MRGPGRVLVCLALMAVLGALAVVGCSGGTKAEVDIEGRILRLTEGDPPTVRVSELQMGRHYEFEITKSTALRQAGKTITFQDLQLGNHIHIRANKSTTSADRYEAVLVELIDTGEGAPTRR